MIGQSLKAMIPKIKVPIPRKYCVSEDPYQESKCKGCSFTAKSGEILGIVGTL